MAPFSLRARIASFFLLLLPPFTFPPLSPIAAAAVVINVPAGVCQAITIAASLADIVRAAAREVAAVVRPRARSPGGCPIVAIDIAAASPRRGRCAAARAV